MHVTLNEIRARVLAEDRLEQEHALFLLRHPSLFELSELSSRVRQRQRPGDHATYIVNTNINYTNICVTECDFCSFYRPPGHPEGVVLSADDILGRVHLAQQKGATQVLLQGGHHPELRLTYFEDLFERIRRETGVWIHALSAPEIIHLSRVEKIPIKEVLARLKKAGLQTLPGGGAEILVDSVRRAISPRKIRSQQWLRVHETAHRLGIRSSATMMFGTHYDGPEDWVRHLDQLRQLQDRTGGFTAFIAWTYQEGDAAVPARKVSTRTYLKVLAVARLYLDNIGTIQASPLTQQADGAGLALQFGADDLGNVLMEEHVVAAAGCEATLTEATARDVIRKAGWKPCRRDTLYRQQAEGACGSRSSSYPKEMPCF